MNISRREFIKSMSVLALTPPTIGFAAGKQIEKNFPVLTAKGSYGSIGFQHGKRFAALIRKNLDFYKKWIPSPRTVDPKVVIAAAEKFIPLMKAAFPHQIEEMEGIAKGAGVTLAEIMIINARTDLKLLFKGNRSLESPPGCTSLAIRSTFGGKKSMALGQNWDWNIHFSDTSVVLRLEPEGGLPLVTFTEAGMLGKIGFNREKLGVCLNFLEHDTTKTADAAGVPIHCLLRTVMECNSLEAAYQKVALSKRNASANFLMAQDRKAEPKMLDLEITPDSVAVLNDKKGYLIHTNHYISPSLEKGCTDKGSFPSANRLNTGRDMLNKLNLNRKSPVDSMKAVLKLRKGAPFSISRSRVRGSQGTTIASIIMDLTHNTLYLAPGSPHKHPWKKFKGV